MNMGWVVAILIVAGVLAFYGFRRARMNNVPQDTFVCDICGEKHCICHKEEETSQDPL